MAVTKTMHMKASGKGKIDIHLEHAINYILQPKKLGNSNLTGGINCLLDSAYEHPFLYLISLSAISKSLFASNSKPVRREFARYVKRHAFHNPVRGI